MSRYQFILQDPSTDDTEYLLDKLFEHLDRSIDGGGAFAWATREGIELLLRDPRFEKYLLQYHFSLVIGSDAITDEDALKLLTRAVGESPNLSVRIFITPEDVNIFHPKFIWFKHSEGGTMIAGSGNLTGGGLHNNLEAFSVYSLSDSEFFQVHETWTRWFQSNANNLREPSDPTVLPYVETNKKRKQKIGHKVSKKDKPALATKDDVLFAEIPKGSTRWNQANFHKDSYENYFGAKVGQRRNMLFRHVLPDATLERIETRPSVAVASHNWRFELGAARGKSYPITGRPIGIFLRIRPRTFVYHLSMPGGVFHSEIEKYMDSVKKGQIKRMRNIRVSSNSVSKLPVIKLLLSVAPTAYTDEGNV